MAVSAVPELQSATQRESSLLTCWQRSYLARHVKEAVHSQPGDHPRGERCPR
jgi:hypothetical protein